ncbi:uncharacterized protein [Nicotiana sylvestris]|uniref:uncharacterized protein n=1 Tax=Nicotiana sylvestris TaxID=4096 RepID=UPI00388C455E
MGKFCLSQFRISPERAEEIEDICGAMRQMLYEDHMVQPGEGSSTAMVSNNADLNNMIYLRTSCPDPKTLSKCEIMNQEPEYDEDEALRKINRALEQFENKPKPNLYETELVNLGSSEEVQETMISIHTDERTRDTLIQLLFEFKDVFSWSYDYMPGLSVDLVLMDEEDAEKKDFTTPWSTYYYRVMPFGLKNVGATYMRAMTAIFHGMMHQEIEVYVDDVIIKSRMQDDHVRDLRKFFERLCKYDLKLNPAKCAFGIPPRNLLVFILLKKDAAIRWTDECQEAFDKIKEYLSNPPVLVPPEPGRPSFLYLTVLENSFGCVLGQHDVTGKKEQAIYYLRKKFTSYEAKYTLLERTWCTLTWVAQKLRHYLLAYTTYLITILDPLKYIFQNPMPTGRLAKWQIMLTEFDIVYVTRMAIKAQALADHLSENPVDDEYQPLSTYFPDKEVNSVEVTPEDTNAWKMFFHRAVNAKGVEIWAILISPIGQHYPATARLRFFCTKNIVEYEACIIGMNMAIDQDVEEFLIMGDSYLIIRQAQGEWETRDIKLIPYRKHVEDLSKWFKSVEFRYIPLFHNELADALATLASMLPYPGNVHIDPLEIKIRERHGYCNTIEMEPHVHPWYHDLKRFLKTKEYPEQASGDQKRTIRRLTSGFFLSEKV